MFNIYPTHSTPKCDPNDPSPNHTASRCDYGLCPTLSFAFWSQPHFGNFQFIHIYYKQPKTKWKLKKIVKEKYRVAKFADHDKRKK